LEDKAAKNVQMEEVEPKIPKKEDTFTSKLKPVENNMF
jgi:hypothetical protein